MKPSKPEMLVDVRRYLPIALQGATDYILDAEVLVVDNKTGALLPFGTLGVNKRKDVHDASNCLFVFDILYLNGRSLVHKPISERRSILEKALTPVGTGAGSKNFVRLSELHIIKNIDEINGILVDVFTQNLEGVMLKDMTKPYEPGKRGWHKVKKDYLSQGCMADSADLVVLGADRGKGKNAGMLSVYLMGAWDTEKKIWKTVCKAGNGFDDAKLKALSEALEPKMVKFDPKRIPSWLSVNKSNYPAMISQDPQSMPVWEIVGAEFTNSDSPSQQTAGISIRFPRVHRERSDKDWNGATDVQRLHHLAEKSKEHAPERYRELLGITEKTPAGSVTFHTLHGGTGVGLEGAGMADDGELTPVNHDAFGDEFQEEEEEPDPAGPPGPFKSKVVEFLKVCKGNVDGVESFIAQYTTAEAMFEALEEKYGQAYAEAGRKKTEEANLAPEWHREYKEKLKEFLGMVAPDLVDNADEMMREYDTAEDMFEGLERKYSDDYAAQNPGSGDDTEPDQPEEKVKNEVEEVKNDEADVEGSSNVGDTRPICPFGKGCYRKNPQHFLDMQHLDKTPMNNEEKGNKPRNAPKRGRSDDEADSEDEAFLARDSEDDEDEVGGGARGEILPSKLRKRAKVSYVDADENGSETDEIEIVDEAVDNNDDDDEDPFAAFAGGDKKKQKRKRDDSLSSAEEDEEYKAAAGDDSETDEEEEAEEEEKGIDEEAGDDDEEEVRPASPVGLPICMYGPKCYRKNPQHFLEYAHPWKKD